MRYKKEYKVSPQVLVSGQTGNSIETTSLPCIFRTVTAGTIIFFELSSASKNYSGNDISNSMNTWVIFC